MLQRVLAVHPLVPLLDAALAVPVVMASVAVPAVIAVSEEVAVQNQLPMKVLLQGSPIRNR